MTYYQDIYDPTSKEVRWVNAYYVGKIQGTRIIDAFEFAKEE